jgi:hypothetical protein
MLKKIFFFVLFAAIIGGGVGYYLWTKPHENMQLKKADFAMSAVEFGATYDEAKHLNKMVEVTGKIAEVVNEIVGEQHNVTLNIETGKPDLTLTCPLDPFLVQAKEFKEGATVRIKGICLGKDMFDIKFDRCVIVP